MVERECAVNAAKISEEGGNWKGKERGVAVISEDSLPALHWDNRKGTPRGRLVHLEKNPSSFERRKA